MSAACKVVLKIIVILCAILTAANVWCGKDGKTVELKFMVKTNIDISDLNIGLFFIKWMIRWKDHHIQVPKAGRKCKRLFL